MDDLKQHAANAEQDAADRSEVDLGALAFDLVASLLIEMAREGVMDETAFDRVFSHVSDGPGQRNEFAKVRILDRVAKQVFRASPNRPRDDVEDEQTEG